MRVETTHGSREGEAEHQNFVLSDNAETAVRLREPECLTGDCN